MPRGSCSSPAPAKKRKSVWRFSPQLLPPREVDRATPAESNGFAVAPPLAGREPRHHSPYSRCRWTGEFTTVSGSRWRSPGAMPPPPKRWCCPYWRLRDSTYRRVAVGWSGARPGSCLPLPHGTGRNAPPPQRRFVSGVGTAPSTPASGRALVPALRE